MFSFNTFLFSYLVLWVSQLTSLLCYHNDANFKSNKMIYKYIFEPRDEKTNENIYGFPLYELELSENGGFREIRGKSLYRESPVSGRWRIEKDTMYLSNDGQIYYPVLHLLGECFAEMLLDKPFHCTYGINDNVCVGLQNIKFGYSNKRIGYSELVFGKNSTYVFSPVIKLSRKDQEYSPDSTKYKKYHFISPTEQEYGIYQNGKLVGMEVLESCNEERTICNYKRRLLNPNGVYTYLSDSTTVHRK